MDARSASVLLKRSVSTALRTASGWMASSLAMVPIFQCSA